MLTAQKVDLRIMVRADLPQVLDIDAASFDNAWDKADYERILGRLGTLAYVAELQGEIVGVMVFERQKKFFYIGNLAVRPDMRRRKIGWQLVRSLIPRLKPEDRNRLVAEVPETNLIAQIFFRDVGFVCVRTLPHFFEDTGEDGYRFVYRF